MKLFYLIASLILGGTSHRLTCDGVAIRSGNEIETVTVYSNTFITRAKYEMEDDHMKKWWIPFYELDSTIVNKIMVEDRKENITIFEVWMDEGCWFSQRR